MKSAKNTVCLKNPKTCRHTMTLMAKGLCCSMTMQILLLLNVPSAPMPTKLLLHQVIYKKNGWRMADGIFTIYKTVKLFIFSILFLQNTLF